MKSFKIQKQIEIKLKFKFNKINKIQIKKEQLDYNN